MDGIMFEIQNKNDDLFFLKLLSSIYSNWYWSFIGFSDKYTVKLVLMPTHANTFSHLIRLCSNFALKYLTYITQNMQRHNMIAQWFVQNVNAFFLFL